LSKLLEVKPGLKSDTVRIPSPGFDQLVVVGAAAKEIVRSLLESCGYEVYPFGYESTFSTLKRQLRDKRLEKSDLAQRIRSMPDFFVTDEEGLLQLVEVKFRKGQSRPDTFSLGNWEVGRYKRYWPESLLVLLSPFGDRFFAQYVKSLKLGSDSFDKTWFQYTDFSSISSIFPRTTGKLEPFHVGIDKLAGLWKEEKD
jgi:hypothetical protein